jgi:hypothetical protein
MMMMMMMMVYVGIIFKVITCRLGQQGISFSQDNLNFQFGILENLIKVGHNSSEKPFSPFILFSRNLLFKNYCRAKENDVLFLDLRLGRHYIQ